MEAKGETKMQDNVAATTPTTTPHCRLHPQLPSKSLARSGPVGSYVETSVSTNLNLCACENPSTMTTFEIHDRATMTISNLTHLDFCDTGFGALKPLARPRVATIKAIVRRGAILTNSALIMQNEKVVSARARSRKISC